jgi:hypothetical protein
MSLGSALPFWVGGSDWGRNDDWVPPLAETSKVFKEKELRVDFF